MEGTRARQMLGEVIFEGVKSYDNGEYRVAKFRRIHPFGYGFMYGDEVFNLNAESVADRIYNLELRGVDAAEEKLALAALTQPRVERVKNAREPD